MKKISLSIVVVCLFIIGFYSFIYFNVNSIEVEQPMSTNNSSLLSYDLYKNIKNEQTEFSEVPFVENSPEETDISIEESDTSKISVEYIPAVNSKQELETDVPLVSENTYVQALTQPSQTQIVTTTTVTTTESTLPKTTTTPIKTTTEVKTTVSTTSPKVEVPIVESHGDLNENLSVKILGSSYTGNGYEIVCRIVANEISSSFNVEAIKAQAVATYSYIKYGNQKGVYPSVSISSSVPTKISNAVKEVYGQTAYYNGSIAQTVYCSSSGGYTASAKDVWGNSVPYLSSVESKYDNLDSSYGATKTYSEQQMKDLLNNAGFQVSGDPQEWIKILPSADGGIVDGGYIGKISICGNASYNGRVLTARILRENILNFGIKSTKFDISYNNGQFTFTTYGYGHGVGMSQHGANFYAENENMNYIEILKHYFSGIEIK